MAANGEAAVPVGTEAEQEVDFKEVSEEQALSILKATHKGLTSEEAAKRLAEYGPNKLPEETRNPFLVYLGYMWNPLSWAMEAAAIIAIALLDYADFALILALLLVNATISYVEEANADKAIKALTSALAPKAKALRDGQVTTIEASNLVPGDIVIIRLGDIVPADIKILAEEGGSGRPEDETPLQASCHGHNSGSCAVIKCDQAALTGESLPVKKFSGDVAFSGSTIKQGERHCVVYATGMQTFFGRAAALLGSANQEANLQKVMTRIGAMCLITIGVWVIIELAVQFGHYGHACYGGSGGCPTLTNMLVIVVGGIPIAMPTVLSVTLALGAFTLAKEGAIVSRMSAVEEMAGMDILCSDKTGTLTLNKLTVDHVNCYPLSGHSIEDVLKYGAMSANIVTEEPIDMVLHESYPNRDTLWEEYSMAKFIPFNPTDKYTVAFVKDNKTGQIQRIMKGAPQVVVRNAHNKAEIEDDCTHKITEYANRGFRGLGIAKAEGDGSADGPNGPHWVMVGLVPLFDPPRHDTKETIERCHQMGISVKMITGDQLLIGKETAKQLGMGTNMFTTEALLKAKQGFGLVEGHASVEDLIEEADGFAEVFPEHKFMIVKTLQERKHMCGMTGDGVNDAPALKKADVGIAVAGATDAARGAADIVLTQPGLSAIITAIIGARKIFQRMTTYAKYTIAMTFRICFTFGLLTVIYNWYFPTILIVLLAVFNDGAMIALSKDTVTPSALPNRWDLTSIFLAGIGYGLYLTLSSWALYYVATRTDFFDGQIGMFSLQEGSDVLSAWCTEWIPQLTPGVSPSAPASTVYPEIDNPSITVLQQCMAEQKYVRGAMTRAMLYLQVSVSGQAVVFVVRTVKHSFLSRAGTLTYVAFFLAQTASTLIAIFGFNGYEEPRDDVNPCQYCTLSSGGDHPFWSNKGAPIAGTESAYTASVLGCTYYVVAAWIWSLIWHMGLDPLKWIMMYMMDDEGFRSRGGGMFSNIFRMHGENIGAGLNLGINKMSMARVSAARMSMNRASMGRVSAGGYQTGGIPGVGGRMVPNAAMLQRASLVKEPAAWCYDQAVTWKALSSGTPLDSLRLNHPPSEYKTQPELLARLAGLDYQAAWDWLVREHNAARGQRQISDFLRQTGSRAGQPPGALPFLLRVPPPSGGASGTLQAHSQEAGIDMGRFFAKRDAQAATTCASAARWRLRRPWRSRRERRCCCPAPAAPGWAMKL
ncbi:plasma-membrane proton-efflux P-type ATPase isoform B [Chlorella sorokiniana]|uniref:Plasma membrane ATPase n=1 Tax=Chlorella sorokiniana TaxID=3076 RepID=A0A2P6TUA5_CHLSO|nr:plasma-membrane proton-efflux P-type ATPase isoform B [Chlorella sorokiniana]|eukprot:PRW57643.1 plasma-membrane proton-efflux P-type ATPase isoform B [Chlorella sorokiniana]